MKKPKKITIKFFLNQLLGPAEIVEGEKNKKYYPLYIQVTYNRKNMQLKSMYGEYYANLKEVKPGLMEFEESIIRTLITYESSHVANPDSYELKGLKKKFEIYSTSLWQALELYLKPLLRSEILKTKDELIPILDMTSAHATVGKLFKGVQLLFKGFHDKLPIKLKGQLSAYEQFQSCITQPVFDFTFPTIIDWVAGNYKKELEKAVKIKFKNKPEAMKNILLLIDAAVSDRLSQLSD